MLNESRDDIEMNDYDTLHFEELFYQYELFTQFNGGLCIPTPGRVHNKDLAPITLLCCDTIQGRPVERPLVILLDGGSSGSLINKRSLPNGAVPSRSEQTHTTTTASGNFKSSLSVGVQNI